MHVEHQRLHFLLEVNQSHYNIRVLVNEREVIPLDWDVPIKNAQMGLELLYKAPGVEVHWYQLGVDLSYGVVWKIVLHLDNKVTFQFLS